MAQPSDKTATLLSSAHSAPLDGDGTALNMTATNEHVVRLNDLSIKGDTIQDQAIDVNGELSNKDQSISQGEQEVDHGANESSKKPTVSASPLLLEIRALQERLSQLEQQTNHESSTDQHGFAIDADGAPDDEEQKRLRKHIRRARWAKKSAESTEKRAEKTAIDREKYGITGPYLFEYGTTDGVPGFGRNFETSDWATVREEKLWIGIDSYNQSNKPARSMRPPTALRPIHSRKLGPPTQWDTSDSEEWSDDSTHSRDFDYFRARLRGDFEWELDRLHAQKRRYMKHKEKKTREREKQEQKEEIANKTMLEASALRGDTAAVTAPLFEEVKKTASAKLHPVGWEVFRAFRGVPEEMCFAIDVLVEEPKISVDTWRKYPKATVLDPKAQTIPAKSIPGHQNGHGPLPERIRIHSRHLIMILARIHGSKLASEENVKDPSLVLLRPFKLLSHYDKEIRDWQSKLMEDHGATKTGAEGPSTDARTDASLAEALNPDADAKNTVNGSPDVQKSSVDDPKGYSTSTEALKHLPCLLEFMDTYLSRKQAYLNSPVCDKITFSDIWYLFKPGDFVISTDGKQAYRVINVTSPPHKGTDRWSYYYASEKENEKSRAQSDISIDCVYIHYDGKKLGPVLERFKIRRFDGERSVTTLEIYPLRFYASRGLRDPVIKSKKEGSGAKEIAETEVAQLSKDLIERGKMFVEVAGVKHMYYAGLTVDARDEVESQVVIDFEEAFAWENQREWCPKITPLVGLANNLGGGEEEEDGGETRSCKADCCRQENVHDDSYVETERSKKFTNDLMAEIEDSPHRLPSVTIYPRALEDTKTEINALKDDELLIMSYRVFGFILRDRTWAQLDLSYLGYIDKDDGGKDNGEEDNDSDEEAGHKSAFGRLVLPKGHKTMVLSLIAQHFRNKGSQDEQADIVRGKGKGLIILLHGAPGVGKTTTAEGVAERFKKPLFQITCGDLGSDAKQVETALQTNFALANRWGCILLLDEADVFLAERRREDFTRNGLVAVFLRVLEYYAGILFLTTNRIGDFDEAFASRIHMSLHYPPLDKISTTKVFKLNLSIIKDRYQAKHRKITIEEDEILEDVSEYFRKNEGARWNGRQIRNACQTALALAEFEAQPPGTKYDLKAKSIARVHLNASHLQIVSNAYLEFIQYLKEVHGTDADTHAKESGIRALETVIAAVKAGKGIIAERDREREEKPLSRFKLKSRSQGQD